jgi:hypothetical protein
MSSSSPLADDGDTKDEAVEFPPNLYEDDQLIVNYKDACIYGRDWKLLSGCRGSDGWLNDSCIHYQLLRLQDRFAVQATTTSFQSSSSSLLLLEPAVTSYFVHQCIDDDELEEFAVAHQLRSKDRLLIPIHDLMCNDDDDASSSSWRIPGRGTHWSLLCLVTGRKDDSISKIWGYHFDSIPNSGNRWAAKCVANKLGALVFQQHNLSSSPSFAQSISVRDCPVPKQRNGQDCGIHVLMTVECILEIWSKAEKPENDSVLLLQWSQTISQNLKTLLDANPNYCWQLRKRIARDILDQATLSSSSIQKP